MGAQMVTTEEDRHYAEQADVFELLYDRVGILLRHFGEPDFLPQRPHGDYTVHGDYSGHPEVVVFVSNLAMLRPNIVRELQQLIREFPGWQITVTVAVRGHDDDWPNMGLYIRSHEIIDGLQRQYFPKEFQNLEYEGARKGTKYD
jgi:hypothetical protein